MNNFSRFIKRLPRIGVGLLLVLLFAAQAGGWIKIPFIELTDHLLYDVRLMLTAPGGVDPRVVIVDIDEKSLLEKESGGEGRWPWPRDRLALLVDRLFDDYGALVVGFDVIFSERDESSGIKTIDQLAQTTLKDNTEFQAQYARIKPSLDFDGRFAASFKDRPVVLGFTFLTPGDNTQKGSLPAPGMTAKELPPDLVYPVKRQGFTANLSLLQKVATDAGHVNPNLDIDGVIRRIPMLIEHDGNYYESLSLATARALLGSEPIKGIFSPGAAGKAVGGLEALDVGGAKVAVDYQLSSYIPYRGPFGSFAYISAADVLNKKASKESLDGKIILIGTTAPGLLDLRTTPVGTAYPGVEIHANLIAGILDGSIKEAPLWSSAVYIAMILVLGIFLAIAVGLTSPLWGTIIAVITLILTTAVNIYSYHQGVVMPLAAALLCFALVYLFNIGYGYFFETRNKKLITGLFGQYVPPELVDEMAKNPANFSMEGRGENLTILFSDVRGFTTISESLDPKALSELMNGFLTPLTEVIYRHGGTIDKYMGDCIMAFWGAPIADAEHARHGVEAAFEMNLALVKINQDYVARGWPEIKIGVGLNTGHVSVGNMGSKIRLAYTVMGDAVNLASRLEGITKEYGATIVIGADTLAQVPDLIARELDKVRVKGKDQAVTIYEPLGFGHEVSHETREALQFFESALLAYRGQHWDTAQAQFTELLTNYSDTGTVLYPLYLKRIEHLRHNPPGADWDGSFTFTTK